MLLASSPSRLRARHLLATSAVLAFAAALQLVCSLPARAQAAAATPAPLPASLDPLSAAVSEASRRFGVPENWIRSVMRVESAGRTAAVSHAGAMGLMQVMPETYAELRRRYGLGTDPFAIRDNVMAGTAYLREMFDRYGAPGFLAAYNAGPGRWEDHLAGRRSLPGETIGYLAKLGPMLDVGVVPVQSPMRSSRPPSAFRAPIFVALHGTPAAGAPSGERIDLRQIIAANTTTVPSGGDLFVRRERVEELPSITPPPTAPGAEAAPPASREPTRSGRPSPPPNPLFVPRSTDPEDR